MSKEVNANKEIQTSSTINRNKEAQKNQALFFMLWSVIGLIVAALYIEQYDTEVLTDKATGRATGIKKNFVGYNYTAIVFTSIFGIAILVCLVLLAKALLSK